jgi:DNA uptake protein ComE-like DNA-binding protein
MFRGWKFVVPAVLAGAVLAVVPGLSQGKAGPVELAQVQSQPLPPPAGTPQTPPATSPPQTTSPPTTPPSTKAEPPKTPTPGTRPTPKTGQPTTKATSCPDEKVDINAASADSLKKLPQIGGQRSNAIIKARPYAKPEDLVRRKVLKKAVFDKIKPCITASGVAPDPGTTPKRRAPATKSSGTATPVPVPVPTPTGGGQPATKPPQ